jgi:hypothetical protein
VSNDVDVFEGMVQGHDPPLVREEVNGMEIFECYSEPQQLAVLPQDRQVDCAVKVHFSPASVVRSGLRIDPLDINSRQGAGPAQTATAILC